jgi:signal transduction histidine kinase
MIRRIPLRPALRVAAAATIAVGVAYLLIVAGIITLVSHRLVAETDKRMAASLAGSQTLSLAQLSSRGPAKGDADDPPVYFWRESAAGSVTAGATSSPTFPAALLRGSPRLPRSVSIGNSQFRFDAAAGSEGSRIFAAESLAQEHDVRNLLLTSALGVSPILLALVFGSAFVIGRQASKPVQQARIRQLEFTADASHELRTPLTVIEAEVGLALGADRTAAGYRAALERVSGESHRLRKIVEDLLWLARFDSEPPPPQMELIDLGALAEGGADRFEPVLRTRKIAFNVEATGDEPFLVAAAPEWIDRLIGVLLDNATRYAGSPGRVVLRVQGGATGVSLTVDDDGPGIAVDERERLFDRFHRIEATPGQGAGLGLAIADTVVRSTHGRWTVGRSEFGGASMTVSWPRVRARSTSRA